MLTRLRRLIVQIARTLGPCLIKQPPEASTPCRRRSGVGPQRIHKLTASLALALILVGLEQRRTAIMRSAGGANNRQAKAVYFQLDMVIQ